LGLLSRAMFEIAMQWPGKNALGTDTMTALRTKLREAAGEPVLFTGSDGAFSAGLNLKEVAELDPPPVRAFPGLLDAAMCEVFQYPAPTVAVLEGHAIAGGCILALCCDHRVATRGARAKIGLNEVALGVRFPPRVLTIARRRLAPQHAENVLLGAGLFDLD